MDRHSRAHHTGMRVTVRGAPSRLASAGRFAIRGLVSRRAITGTVKPLITACLLLAAIPTGLYTQSASQGFRRRTGGGAAESPASGARRH